MAGTSDEAQNTALAVMTKGEILGSHPSVPDHVVHREFVNETVVLNLQTGTYHGLNPSGGKMLEALESAPTVGDAAAALAELYAVPVVELEDDLCAFCGALHERGLLVLDRV